MNFIHYDKIDSTNSEALRRLSGSNDIRSLDQTVIAAFEQSAGRGRMQRAFYSPAKSGIYFTAIHAPKNPIQEPAKLTAAAAVAVCRSLKDLLGIEAKIKWVNDIYVNQKKVCGILAEGHLSKEGKIDAAAIGIGINIYQNDFPPEISARAGSVLDDRQGKKSGGDLRVQLASDVCQKLFELLNDEEKNKAALLEYASLSFIIGKEITVIPVIGEQESSYKATVLSIDKEARLHVRLFDGSERALSSGEISIKL